MIKKERKIIYSLTIEPSLVAKVMDLTGQDNWSQIVRDAVKEYIKMLEKDKQNNYNERE